MNIHTPELLARVMKLWSPPEFYVLSEVRNGTGYSKAEGYADVLAMSVWPSRGLELIGAELKVSRSDWLRELKDPAKAEKFVKHCHRWYIITANGAAREDEIPKNWGWMIAGEKGLKAVKAAPILEPQVPDFLLLAAIFRKIGAPMQGMVSQSELNQLVCAGVAKEQENLKQTLDHLGARIEEEKEKHGKLWNAIQAFESASGISLDKWSADAEKFRAEGERYRLFRQGGIESLKKDIRQFQERLIGLGNYVGRVLE